MKKIININLSGRVIPIEDSAYEKLQAYIESLRRYFIKEEGRDEIINDIESRVAEIMNEKIRKGANSITDDDVDEIIASMGRPEDFEAEEAEATASGPKSQQSSYKEEPPFVSRKRNRLYRDSSDKILGGVCAGLANYMNVDPAIIRILFAIVTFGGFGFGFLAYILLWIVLPARDLEHYGGRRLYRNPEERVFGGVASGLAAYFKREAWTMRLLFAAPILLSIILSIVSWPFYHEGVFIPNVVFGSLSGTFIFAYIILWIVLPEAHSDYQRMEMRGEKVDVNTIRQNVKDRAKDFSEDVKATAQNIGSKAKDFANTRGKEFASEVREAARRTGNGFGHVIGVLFKAFFLFIAGTIAFGLLVGLMALIFGGIGIWPIKNFLLDGFWQNTFAWGTLFLFLAVPIVALITWLIRRMMRVRSQNSYLGWIFGGLWTLGWVSASLFAASMVNDFRMSNERKAPADFAITQPVNNKMIVKVSEPEIEYGGEFSWVHFDDKGFDITEDTVRISNIKIRIEMSRDSNYHVEIKKVSRGETTNEAEIRAQKIGFNASFRDSILDLGSGISIDKESKFRAQQVVVVIEVPVNKKIRFDETVNKLHSLTIRTDRDKKWHRNNGDFDINWDEYFDYDTDVDYEMGKDGYLVNLSNPEKKVDDDNNQIQDDKDRKIKKEQLKQELKKIEEEDKKDSINKKATTMSKSERDASIQRNLGSIACSMPFSLSTLFN
ncbi:MAG TPA: PspC domain-containing protein [Chitinophagaceae bacterium]|nr:PspC domain-containing protein [Chitinophagaceae bacterium]